MPNFIKIQSNKYLRQSANFQLNKGLNEFVWLREERNKVYLNVKLEFGKMFPQRFGRSQECLWGMLCVSSKCWNKFCWLADESVPKHQRVSQQQPAEARPEPEEAGQSLIGGGEERGGGGRLQLVSTRDGTPATSHQPPGHGSKWKLIIMSSSSHKQQQI